MGAEDVLVFKSIEWLISHLFVFPQVCVAFDVTNMSEVNLVTVLQWVQLTVVRIWWVLRVRGCVVVRSNLT